MANIIKKLFGSEEKADELARLHENLRIAVGDLKNLEQDWREKVRIIKDFTDNWNKDWDLRRLENNIKVVKKLDAKSFGELKREKSSILYIRHLILSRSFSLADYARIKHLFDQEEGILDKLEEVLKKQLEFIEKNSKEDVGVVRYKINEFSALLKEEATLLGMDKKMFRLIIEIEKKVGTPSAYLKRIRQLKEWGYLPGNNVTMTPVLLQQWEFTERFAKACGRYKDYVFRWILSHSSFPNWSTDRFAYTLDLIKKHDFGALILITEECREDDIIKMLTEALPKCKNIIDKCGIKDIVKLVQSCKQDHIILLLKEGLPAAEDLITKENLMNTGLNIIELIDAQGDEANTILKYSVSVYLDLIKSGFSTKLLIPVLAEICSKSGNLLDFLGRSQEVLKLCAISFLKEIPEDKITESPKLIKKIVTYEKIRAICLNNFFHNIFNDSELQWLIGKIDMRILTTKYPDDVKKLIKMSHDLGESGYSRWYMLQNIKALRNLKSCGVKLAVWLGNKQLHLVQRAIAPGISNISPEEYKRKAIDEQITLFSNSISLILSIDMFPNKKERDRLYNIIITKSASILSVSKSQISNLESFKLICSSNIEKIPDVITKTILPQIQDNTQMEMAINPEMLQNFFGARGDLEQIAESIVKILSGKIGESKILQLSFNVSKKYPLNLQIRTKWDKGISHFFQPSVLTIGNDGGCCIAMGGVNEFAGYNFFLDADALLVNILDNNKKRVGMILAFAAVENNSPILALNTVETPFRADTSIYPIFCDLCMQMLSAFAHVSGFHKIVIGKGYGSSYFQQAYPETELNIKKISPFKTDKRYYTNAFEGGKMEETPEGIVLSYEGKGHLIWDKSQGIMRNKLALDSIKYNQEFKRAA